MAKEKIVIEKSGEGLKVSIFGNLNEDTDFKKFPLEGAKQIEFELDGVTGINSCGVREWIVWVAKAGPVAMTLYNCPKVVVDQVNMVQGFLPATAQIKSFYVPYFAEGSGEEKDVLFTFGKEFSEAGVQPPTKVTDSKGEVMEMDIVEAKYFKFIKK